MGHRFFERIPMITGEKSGMRCSADSSLLRMLLHSSSDVELMVKLLVDMVRGWVVSLSDSDLWVAEHR